MTTYNIKSTLITNRDATPPSKVFTDSYIQGGIKSSSEGYVQTHGAADGAGSIYRLCTVPSGARVTAVNIQTDALATGCTLNCGVYWPTSIPVGAGLSAANASAVINTTLYASALAASNANSVTNIINQSTNNSIANQELPLWQACGLTSDPMIDLDICVEVQAAVAAQGYIGLTVDYQK